MDVSIRYGFLHMQLFFGVVSVIAGLATGGWAIALLLPFAAAMVLVGLRPVVRISSDRVLIRNLLDEHVFKPGDGRLALHNEHWWLQYSDDAGVWKTATAAKTASGDGDSPPRQYELLERKLREYGFISDGGAAAIQNDQTL